MANSKLKKYKKLRKAHIWPSIVFLLISLLLVCIASCLFASLILTYFAADRIFTSFHNTERICRMLTQAQTKEEQLSVFRSLEQDSGLSEAVYILDENGNALIGFGDQTYNFADGAFHNYYSGNISLYTDQDSALRIFDENMDIDMEQVALEVINNSVNSASLDIRSIFDFEQKIVWYEDNYWIGIEIPDTGILMVKCKLYFYNGDFLLAFIISVLSTAIMLLPVQFLFINVLINVFHQGRMTKLIYTDKTTGGNSWLYFEHHADKKLNSKKRSGKTFAVVDVALMKYRSYCTCHGMEAGELLLQQIDTHLSSFKKRGEITAHYEKSDFALLLDADSKEACIQRVTDMLNTLPDLLSHDHLIFHAGIYFVETGKNEGSIRSLKKKEIDVAEYYNRASSARASLADDNRISVAAFDDKLLEEQLWEHRVEEKMQRALDNEEFQVYLQPKYNPVTEKLAGAEALVRWINEEDGFISPGRFIPIFEKNGFIVKLDDYMISHVAKLQAQWLSEGKNIVPVSVNVSRAHFANPNLASHICALVDEYQLPHHFLEIELTESAFFDDKAALLRTVRELKEMGFDISMDDFGAGYSSLNSLKDLPLDVLKLDAEFFRGDADEERGEIVVSQAISLAKQLNMRIVAEGVEKKNQVDFLASQNCDMIQGFYFAKPMPAQEYQERL